MDPLWPNLLDVVLLLAFAGLLGGLMERIGQSALLGYLLAGALLGPGILNIVSGEAVLRSLSEIGVALLLFSIGLEISWPRIRDLGLRVALAGCLQIIFTVGVMALGAMALGLPAVAALAIGAAMAPSSTACVLRLLGERQELETPHGRVSLGILLTQDMALVPLAIMLSALGTGGGPGAVIWQIAKTFTLAAGLIGLLVLLGKSGLPMLIRFVLPKRNREIPVMLAVTVCLGATWGAHTLHLSPAFGAFVAGLFLAGTPYGLQIRSEVGPLRVLFVVIFFAAVGMFADPRWMAGNLGPITLLVGATLVGKTFLTWLAAMIVGQRQRHALAAGISLSQMGEFSFVLAEIALLQHLITEEDYALLASATLVTLFITPALVAWGPTLGGLWERSLVRVGVMRMPGAPSSGEGAALPECVLVAGFGPVGQRVCLALSEIGVPPLVIDLNPRNIREAKRLGYQAEIGDATMAEVLHHIHLERCRAVVVTVPDWRMAATVTAQVRSLAEHVPVFARARYHPHTLVLLSQGAEHVIDEEMEIGRLLGDRVIQSLKESG